MVIAALVMSACSSDSGDEPIKANPDPAPNPYIGYGQFDFDKYKLHFNGNTIDSAQVSDGYLLKEVTHISYWLDKSSAHRTNPQYIDLSGSNTSAQWFKADISPDHKTVVFEASDALRINYWTAYIGVTAEKDGKTYSCNLEAYNTPEYIEENFSHPYVELSKSACKDATSNGVIGPESFSCEAVNGCLKVTHKNAYFTCNTQISATARVEENVITIIESGPDTGANCVCPYDITMSIWPLRQKQYTVNICRDNAETIQYSYVLNYR